MKRTMRAPRPLRPPRPASSVASQFVALAVFACIAAWPTNAFAHSVNKRFGDFYGGMLHPITAIEHLFPIIGLSLLSAQQGAKNARWVLLAFPVGLLGGAIVANFVGPNAYIDGTNRGSFVVLGLLVAAAVRVPVSVLASVSLLLGVTHGIENTADIANTVSLRVFVPGVVVSGLTLIAIVAAIGVCLERPWQRVAIRVMGSWIGAIGLLVVSLPS